MVSSKTFIVIDFTLGPWSILSQFFIWCEEEIQSHSLACENPVAAATPLGKIILSLI